eukprot:COSAG01_NODE_598_length_15018_cov_60.164488_2_plen_74_part_00
MWRYTACCCDMAGVAPASQPATPALLGPLLALRACCMLLLAAGGWILDPAAAGAHPVMAQWVHGGQDQDQDLL